MNPYLKDFIRTLPKAELHVHLEGTLEPQQYMIFAERNKVTIPYQTLEQAQEAYAFTDFQSFIEAYSQITQVLYTEEDFYDITFSYLKKIASQGVLHTEISFGFQEYLSRNISPGTIVNGIHQAIIQAQKLFGISAELILCFIRNRGPQSAAYQLELAVPFKEKIKAVGLASLEDGYSPSAFKKVFEKAAAYGYHRVAHAGESSITNLYETIDLLGVERIDHGIQSIHDPSLIKKILEKNIALTLCPLSNLALKFISHPSEHPLKRLFDTGIQVTLNSDDPAFFKGYIAENYYIAASQMGLSLEHVIQCAKNSFTASFASAQRKIECLEKLDNYLINHHYSNFNQ